MYRFVASMTASIILWKFCFDLSIMESLGIAREEHVPVVPHKSGCNSGRNGDRPVYPDLAGDTPA